MPPKASVVCSKLLNLSSAGISDAAPCPGVVLDVSFLPVRLSAIPLIAPTIPPVLT
mgnify:CR=1 FL=1